MIRQIILSEEFGLYRLRDTYGGELGKGTSVERALRNAFEKRAEPGTDLNIRSTHDAAQLLEDFLGERRDDPEAPVVP